MRSSPSGWIEPVADAAWLARRREAVLAPELTVIDPHHHLWVLGNQSYLLPDLEADLASGHRVEATIYMEASMGYDPADPSPMASAGEIDYALAARAMADGPAVSGIVSYIDLRRDRDVVPVVLEHLRRGKGALAGVRDTVSWSPYPELRNHRINPDAGALLTAPFRRGAAVLADHSLPLDLWLYQDQLAELAVTARQLPQVTFVVDHCGGPLMTGIYADHKPSRFAAWEAGIKALSDLPNVFLKLGGLGMRTVDLRLHERADPPSSEDLAEVWAPFVDICVAAAGPSRCMFESNFPVDKEVASYRTIWNAFKRLAMPYGTREARMLLAGTARAVYRLSAH